MNAIEIRKKIYDLIYQIAMEQSIPIKIIEDDQSLVDDLGFRSLDVATLIVMLEDEFAVDPFMDGCAAITDMRTVDDLCNLYINYVETNSMNKG